jgi:hypothetical protein
MEVKEIIPNLNKKVIYDNSEYLLTGSTVRKTVKGKIYYDAELLDRNKRSICIVRLEDVKCYGTAQR